MTLPVLRPALPVVPVVPVVTVAITAMVVPVVRAVTGRLGRRAPPGAVARECQEPVVLRAARAALVVAAVWAV
jgi:hypothetical protein